MRPEQTVPVEVWGRCWFAALDRLRVGAVLCVRRLGVAGANVSVVLVLVVAMVRLLCSSYTTPLSFAELRDSCESLCAYLRESHTVSLRSRR